MCNPLLTAVIPIKYQRGIQLVTGVLVLKNWNYSETETIDIEVTTLGSLDDPSSYLLVPIIANVSRTRQIAWRIRDDY